MGRRTNFDKRGALRTSMAEILTSLFVLGVFFSGAPLLGIIVVVFAAVMIYLSREH